MNLGINYNVPMRDYLAFPAMSRSTLSHIRPTPAHLWEFMHTPPEEPEPAHFMLGTLIHRTILEPDKPWPQIAVKPEEMKFSTREGKDWKAEMEAAGKVIMTTKDYGSLIGCARSACQNDWLQRAMRDGHSEVSVMSKDILTGLPIKARIDWLPASGCNFLLDIKTVHDASKRGFEKAATDFGWWEQAAWYLDAFNAVSEDDPREVFIFCAVEKDPPFALALYEVDAPTIQRARARNEHDMRVYADCLRTGQWWGYNPEPELVDAPAWALREEV